MKKIIAFMSLIVLVAFAANCLQAAEPQTKKGDMFVGYGFSGLSELGIDGSILWAGKFIKNDLAVFAGLTFDFKTTDSSEDKHDVKDNSYAINLGLEWYAMKKGSVAFRLAPQIIYENINGDRNENSTKYTIDESKFGVGFALGVVWWASESISFMGGSIVGFERTLGTKDFGADKKEYSSTLIGFLDRRTKIGITFHF